MSKKLAEEFSAKYRPIAEQVGKEIGVDPNIILSQWALESAYGKKVPASNNIAGIQDFSGKGKAAKDPQTGKTGKYVEFEDPETFGMYYADMIKRQFPHVVNTGEDLGAFTRGLVAGRSGSYFEAKPQGYAAGLAAFYNTFPGVERLEAPDVTQFVQQAPTKGEDGLSLVASPPAPPPPPPGTDQSGASPGERFLLGGAGAATGAVMSGGQRIGAAKSARAVRQAGMEEAAREAARLQAQRAASASAPTAPGGAPAAPAGPAGAGRQPIPSGGPDGGRLARGQTGTMPYNYAKSAGLTDIEAGRALDMTKQAGGVHDLATQRREGMQRIQQLFPGERYVENPRFGGLLTPDLGAGSGPRQSFAVQGPMRDVPPGTLFVDPPTPEGGLRQIPPRQPVSTVAPPTVRSGLDAVADTFKSLMRPVASAAGTVAKYALPPAAGLSAGLDVAEVMHEYDKPKDQRDYTKMMLKGASAVGGGLSMFPPAAVVGVPLSLGASAIQAYREDPGMLERAKRLMQQRLQEAGQAPYSDPMTGFMP